MFSVSPKRWTALLAALALSGGCNCGKRGSTGLVASEGDLTAKPVSLNFGNVPIHQRSALVLELINAGAGSLSIEDQTISGDTTHSFSAATFPTDYAVRQSATASVTFSPTQPGPVSAQLLFDNDGSPAQLAVTLQGTGIAIDVTCTPSALSFGAVPIGTQPAATQTFVCTNNGTTPSLVSVNAIDTDAQFSVYDAQGPVDASKQQPLAPGGSYTVTVGFSPSVVGNVTSAFTYTLCADPTTCVAPQPVPLTGEGISGFLQISPSPINFTNVPVGQSLGQPVTLTNLGSAALTVSCLSFNSQGSTACGSASGPFSFSGLPALPLTLAPNQTATFTIQYAAQSATATDQLDATYALSAGAGSKLATAPINANASTAPCALTIAPATLYFGWTTPGQMLTQSATLTNTGTSVCNISRLQLSQSTDPSYTLDPSQASSFPIASGASATVIVDYDLNDSNPPNQRLGAVDFQSNDPNHLTGQIPLLASLETIGSTCPSDHPNLFTGQTDQGGTCQVPSDCTTGLTCTNAACWLLGEQSPVQVVLSWDYAEDLDLHVVEPQSGGPDRETLPDGGTQQGCEIYYSNGVQGGIDTSCTPVGSLNRDAQAACYAEDVNVEEVTYPAGSAAPAGWYTVRADFWSDCDSMTGQNHPSIPYVVQVRVGGYLESYCGTFTPNQADMGSEGSGVTIFQFQLLADGGLL